MRSRSFTASTTDSVAGVFAGAGGTTKAVTVERVDSVSAEVTEPMLSWSPSPGTASEIVLRGPVGEAGRVSWAQMYDLRGTVQGDAVTAGVERAGRRMVWRGLTYCCRSVALRSPSCFCVWCCDGRRCGCFVWDVANENVANEPEVKYISRLRAK